MNIGATIKKLRIKNGLTQLQLAEYLNVSTQTVSRWETASTYPDIFMLPALAKRFGVTVDYLLSIGGNVMKTIESERFLIREWRESDAEALLEVKRNSENFMGYLDLDTVSDSLNSIKIWIEYQEMFPVILKETGKLVGVVGLVDVNRHKGYRELEVYVGDEYNDVSHVTEAHRLILKYGFEEMGIVIAFVYCACDDEILKRAMLDTGFVYEGTLRKFGRDMNDRMRYSILKEELR